MERGNYVRVCVEVDLAAPVKKRAWIQDHWHEVEFESLHLIYSSCHRYGHVARECTRLEVSGRNRLEEKTALVDHQNVGAQEGSLVSNSNLAEK